MEVEKLASIGESLGLRGTELRSFIEGEQNRAREERMLDRERVKEEQELVRLQVELERSRGERSEETLNESRVHVRAPKLPTFSEDRDNLDTYLSRFERYASAQSWPQASWATNLSALLTGKALDTYSRLSDTEALDYDTLKRALLKRYDITSEEYRKKLRSARPDSGESASQFVYRMRVYLKKWLILGGYQENLDNMKELVLIEQFYDSCSREMAMFIRERKPRSLDELSEIADRFIEARGGWRLTNVSHKPRTENSRPDFRSKITGTPEARKQPPSQDKQTNRPRREGCYVCGSKGHFARNCNEKRQGRLAAGMVELAEPQGSSGRGYAGLGPQPLMSSYGTAEMQTRTEVERGDHHTEESNFTLDIGEAACLLIDSCIPCLEAGRANRSQEQDLPVVSVACEAKSVRSMPVVRGLVNGVLVETLRDSGSTAALVKEKLVKPGQMTGKQRLCLLIDRTVRRFPLARIHVDTPYFTGELEVLCVSNPIYPLILGNLDGVRNASDPDLDWKPPEQGTISYALAAETRQQARERWKPIKGLKVPGQLTEVTPDGFRKAQEADKTLDKIRQRVAAEEVKVSRNGNKSSFKMLNGVLYREFQDSRAAADVNTQLIVPQPLRKQVLKLAHESVMGGHLGASKTGDRILANFFWPGMHHDVKLFCRSCDSCQRSFPKGKVTKVPLGSTPLIDEPFHRVAVDIVGPIAPISSKGNRYILTLVDYATRYPEAVPLRNIDTSSVAEALLSIFSRVGFPKEMLTDRGSQFTSGVMKEVSRLLSLRHIMTTPYHPQCNGLVEKFNGTLKRMLVKMCEERPKDWDRYIDSLLFAYRETPQSSTGFAPFELLYGRVVRGPLLILRELWTKDFDHPETKSTYQFVLDLKEKMEKTCEIAQRELHKSHEKYRKSYNRKAKKRSFKVGDEVLVLLPTDHNKLLMHWKGPFRIVQTHGPFDYRVDLGKRVATLHANLLKQYLRREAEEPEQTNAAVVDLVATSVIEDEDDSEVGGNNNGKGTGKIISSPSPLLPLPSLHRTQTYSDVQVSKELSDVQHRQVSSLLREFDDILTDVPSLSTAGHHDIQLIHDVPVKSRPYPLPHAKRQTVKDEIREMLALGVIEPSCSPYASPIVLISKKDGSVRFCCDFRKINAITVPDAEPIPDQEEIFAKLANDNFFTKVDLTKGYWQVPLTEQAKPITAFVTPDGLYQFTSMPFGLMNAPASFSRLMRTVLRGLEFVDNFIDDILVHTPTWDQHIEALRSLMVRLRESNLKAKPKKCFVGFAKVDFLGHQLSRGYLRPLHNKVEDIQTAPRPTTKKELRSFLGLAGYYRKFVPHFATTAVPLTDLLKKGKPNMLDWDEVHENAFTSLKVMLTKEPILHLPDVNRQFILRTDASNKGVGAVLLQEFDGEKFPIAYASKKLLVREQAYSTIEKECLAVVWAVLKFETFLFGREFILEVDHQPLLAIQKSKVANGRILRWALALQQYKFRVEAIKGQENVGADYLSRV
ncbi:uncharacterized protein LOC135157721 [Lytechinus pictus]|uniref:uncharacterized protein LOC135157721 n=1 Tax=Lytechinus pictus TaxID=7653 RepID=UPI0030B9D15F